MPRRCTVCDHPDREAIDLALVAGGSLRDIAGQFRISKSALARHKGSHVPACLAKAQEAQEVAQADDLLAQLRDLQARTLAILTKAEEGTRRDLRTALAAIGEARRNLELLGKLAGELQQEGTVNITLNPEWVELRTVILTALTPYPDARLAVARAVGDGHAQD